MIASLIFVVSLAALLQFFVSYCRSVLASYGRQELSRQGREVTGIEDRIVHGDEFDRLLELVRLCPEPGNDRGDIRAVRAYYGLLNSLRAVACKVFPPIAAWSERERVACAYFAAVALDRRIAFSRDLMAQQVSNQL